MLSRRFWGHLRPVLHVVDEPESTFTQKELAFPSGAMISALIVVVPAVLHVIPNSIESTLLLQLDAP